MHSKDDMVAAMVKQLLKDREVALKSNQAGTALAASRMIATLLGLSVEPSSAAEPQQLIVNIDKDLAKVVLPPPEPLPPSPEEAAVVAKLLKLLDAHD